jgi:hypothetical protein
VNGQGIRLVGLIIQFQRGKSVFAKIDKIASLSISRNRSWRYVLYGEIIGRGEISPPNSPVLNF